ncbi:charged multivesicular body protein 4c isoform X1 [Ictalurus punctatus]|uniref:Charged multivesicular body protein 4c isoform X1 n=1 Tax=Ictalurus punctatus TaxID=7998 RepID=A0A979EKC1_ICTPU|nr:charged multivesicular body protein 4c isoform X1 [Ictalurus punctatus]
MSELSVGEEYPDCVLLPVRFCSMQPMHTARVKQSHDATGLIRTSSDKQTRKTASALTALQALKRKKRLEQQLTQIDGTLSTIEFQREAVENANTNAEVLKNMSMAAKAIKGVHEKIDLDNIDSLMEDITEQQQIAQEISGAISQPFGEQFDEDELLAELEELEQEELEESMKNMGRLPSVPTSKLPSTRPSHRTTTKKRVEDEDDMKMLAAWAS